MKVAVVNDNKTLKRKPGYLLRQKIV